MAAGDLVGERQRTVVARGHADGDTGLHAFRRERRARVRDIELPMVVPARQ